MRRSQADVAFTAALSVVYCLALVLRAPVAVTAVLGVALILAPGYVWAEVLLGARVAGLERVAVTAGLALALPVLGGLALYAAGLPLHRATWAGLLVSVTLVGDVLVLALRRAGRREPGQPGPRLAARHAVAFGAAAAIGVGAVGLAHAAAVRQAYPGFTQLWLSARGQDTHAASLGVRNHQGSTTRYRLVLRQGQLRRSWTLTLTDGQTWQQPVSISGRVIVTAKLYRLPDLSRPYRYVSTGDRQPGS